MPSCRRRCSLHHPPIWREGHGDHPERTKQKKIQGSAQSRFESLLDPDDLVGRDSPSERVVEEACIVERFSLEESGVAALQSFGPGPDRRSRVAIGSAAITSKAITASPCRVAGWARSAPSEPQSQQESDHAALPEGMEKCPGNGVHDEYRGSESTRWGSCFVSFQFVDAIVGFRRAPRGRRSDWTRPAKPAGWPSHRRLCREGRPQIAAGFPLHWRWPRRGGLAATRPVARDPSLP